jgi:hypothetical protein
VLPLLLPLLLPLMTPNMTRETDAVISHLNSTMLPEGVRCAFMPSKTDWP